MNTLPKLPRPNTGARAVIDQLIQRDLTFTEAEDIYCIARRNISGTYPSRHYTGMTITRLLKKYAHKTGKSGTRAPWKFGKPPTILTPTSAVLPDIDEDFDGELDDGTTEYVNDRFSLPEDEMVKTLDVGAYKVDGIVKYVGPLEQDRNQLGRIMAVDDVNECCDIMWATTTETEHNVPMEDLEIFKESISKREEPVRSRILIPGKEIGDKVVYAGSEYGTKGKVGKVVGIYRERRQVQWEGNMGQSSEDPCDLEPYVAPPPPPLAIGSFVSCKKHGLVFPAKVILGPMSTGDYKVVAPNGVPEWVSRDQMTPVEEKDLYQATPQKPAYEGEAPDSEATRLLRQQLAASVRKDKNRHWARTAIKGLSDEQRDALFDVLKDEVFGSDD